MKNLILVLVLSIVLLANTICQGIRFNHLGIQDGLSQNTILSLEVDHKDQVWIGTLDGLNKFNGFDFQVFRQSKNKKNNLIGSAVSAIEALPNGDLWIITSNGGLNKYHAKTERFQYFADSLFGEFQVRHALEICSENPENLWMLGNNELVWFKVSDSTCSSYRLEEEKEITGICSFKENSLLLYGPDGLFTLTNKKGVLLANIIESIKVHRLIKEESNYLALCNSYILRFSEDFSKVDTLVDLSLQALKPEATKILSLACKENEIWLGGLNALWRYNILESDVTSEKFEYNATNKYSILGHGFAYLKYDNAGNLWIGTMKHGINQLSRKNNNLKHFNWKHNLSDDLNIDPVRAICLSKTGDLWLGFDRQGIGIIKENGAQKLITHYVDEKGQRRLINSVRCVFEDSQNNIWIGTGNNLCLYNPKSGIIESSKKYFGFSWLYRTYAIKEFHEGEITLTGNTRLGFFNLQTKTLISYSHINMGVNSGELVRDICKDTNKSYWLALDRYGLLNFNPQNGESKIFNSETHGLSDNKVYALALKNDSLWIATNAGLSLFDTRKQKTIATYYKEDGLSNNIVYSVYIDSITGLWMSTDRGISQLTIKSGQITNFLPNDFFMDDAHFFAQNGEIFYGGYTGVIGFKPIDLITNKSFSKPFIESFHLFNELINPGEYKDGKVLLKQNINEANKINLNHKQNSFSVTFNAHPFDLPNTMQFRYRLINLQEQWVYPEAGTRRATYNKLDPGKYIFQICSANERNNWSSAKELKILISPPFWKTIWFKIITVVLITLTIILLVRLRITQIEKRNKWLQEKVEEQTSALVSQNEEIRKISAKLHEADQSKLRFFTNISHEFRTPLTLILGHLEDLSARNITSTKTIIKNNSLRLLRLINQLIEFRKLDQDSLKLSISKFDLIPFIQVSVESFQILAKRKNIGLIISTELKELSVWLDEDKLDKIIFNLLSNALKYTTENKSIVIFIDESDTEIQIRIKDEGIGIAKKEQEKIFTRFYRSEKNPNHTEGHGIGLALIKGLTEIQQGKIRLESKENRGSTFTVSFKKGKEHFKKEDFRRSQRNNNLLEEENRTVPEYPLALSELEILLVEDNQELKNYISGLLQNKYQIISAVNGMEALTLLKNWKPDLIISDIMMPLLDGIEFCKKIKQDKTLAHIPFILLTGKTDLETRLEGFELGIDEYIEKPFNPKELLARIDSVLLTRNRIKTKLVDEGAHALGNKNSLSKQDKKFWSTLNKHISSKYADADFNTEKLSELMNMGRTTFYRKFKNLTGQNASDHIRNYRLNKALELLAAKELSIAQVCNEIGFKSLPQFRSSFKTHFGKTPSEFQQEGEINGKLEKQINQDKGVETEGF